MRFDILTIFPGMFESFMRETLIAKAIKKKRMAIYVHNIRRATNDKHHTVDDRPYGGGPGMILKVDPILKTLRMLPKKKKRRIILLSPQGTQFSQKVARRLAGYEQIILISGRYEGFDHRVTKYVDEELSIGPYVMSGGEIPAMVVVETVSRLIPGVIGHPDAAALTRHGWVHERNIAPREEIYLNARPSALDDHGVFDEIVRLHQEDGLWRFVFKNRAEDRLFSHRRTINFEVSDEESRNILAVYPEILRLRHTRHIFLQARGDDGHSDHVLHIDLIEGLGDFTELKARGSAKTTHTQELLELATALGFTPADILEGSYLHLALAQQHEREGF